MDSADDVGVLVCPEGASPGEQLTASTASGRKVVITIPDGVQPGSEFSPEIEPRNDDPSSSLEEMLAVAQADSSDEDKDEADEDDGDAATKLGDAAEAEAEPAEARDDDEEEEEQQQQQQPEEEAAVEAEADAEKVEVEPEPELEPEAEVEAEQQTEPAEDEEDGDGNERGGEEPAITGAAAFDELAGQSEAAFDSLEGQIDKLQQALAEPEPEPEVEPEPAPLARGALLWGTVGAVLRGVRAKTLAPHPEREHILRLICPDGVEQGHPLTFEGPDGQELTCEVPEGVEPGMEFEIEVGESPSAEPEPEPELEPEPEPEPVAAQEDEEQQPAAEGGGGGREEEAVPPLALETTQSRISRPQGSQSKDRTRRPNGGSQARQQPVRDMEDLYSAFEQHWASEVASPAGHAVAVTPGPWRDDAPSARLMSPLRGKRRSSRRGDRSPPSQDVTDVLESTLAQVVRPALYSTPHAMPPPPWGSGASGASGGSARKKRTSGSKSRAVNRRLTSPTLSRLSEPKRNVSPTRTNRRMPKGPRKSEEELSSSGGGGRRSPQRPR